MQLVLQMSRDERRSKHEREDSEDKDDERDSTAVTSLPSSCAVAMAMAVRVRTGVSQRREQVGGVHRVDIPFAFVAFFCGVVQGEEGVGVSTDRADTRARSAAG